MSHTQNMLVLVNIKCKRTAAKRIKCGKFRENRNFKFQSRVIDQLSCWGIWWIQWKDVDLFVQFVCVCKKNAQLNIYLWPLLNAAVDVVDVWSNLSRRSSCKLRQANLHWAWMDWVPDGHMRNLVWNDERIKKRSMSNCFRLMPDDLWGSPQCSSPSVFFTVFYA